MMPCRRIQESRQRSRYRSSRPRDLILAGMAAGRSCRRVSRPAYFDDRRSPSCCRSSGAVGRPPHNRVRETNPRQTPQPGSVAYPTPNTTTGFGRLPHTKHHNRVRETNPQPDTETGSGDLPTTVGTTTGVGRPPRYQRPCEIESENSSCAQDCSANATVQQMPSPDARMHA